MSEKRFGNIFWGENAGVGGIEGNENNLRNGVENFNKKTADMMMSVPKKTILGLLVFVSFINLSFPKNASSTCVDDSNCLTSNIKGCYFVNSANKVVSEVTRGSISKNVLECLLDLRKKAISEGVEFEPEDANFEFFISSGSGDPERVTKKNKQEIIKKYEKEKENLKTQKYLIVLKIGDKLFFQQEAFFLSKSEIVKLEEELDKNKNGEITLTEITSTIDNYYNYIIRSLKNGEISKGDIKNIFFVNYNSKNGEPSDVVTRYIFEKVKELLIKYF